MQTIELLQLVKRIDDACQYCRENIPVKGTYHEFWTGVYAPCTAIQQRADFMEACVVGGQRVIFQPLVEHLVV